MPGVICVDAGTTSMRAVLFDAMGRLHHVVQRASAPVYGDHGCVEQDARAWQAGLQAVLSGCAAAAAGEGIAPACIAVTAQRSSVLPVDAAGAPLHAALMWQDTRAAPLARTFLGEQPEVYRRCGLRVSPVFSALKMAWLRRERAEVWRRTHKLLGVQDWLLFLLTGRYVTDQTFASRTGLFSLQHREWDDALLELFEVPRRLLCEVVPPGATVGGLDAQLARACGLPAGLPVVSAGGDQQCAALGLGLLDSRCAVANGGTGSFLIGHADRPMLDDAMRISCNVAALPGTYIVEAAQLTTGAVLQWLARLTGASPEVLEVEAAAAAPGCGGVLVLPHFEGSGTPSWDPGARGAALQLGLDTTRGTLARAVLEGIAYELRSGLEIVEPLCGAVDAVHLGGGLSRSLLFDRIACDVLERPVKVMPGGEATAQGAWIAGALASGFVESAAQGFARLQAGVQAPWLEPQAEQREAYRRQRARAEEAFEALQGRPGEQGRG